MHKLKDLSNSFFTVNLIIISFICFSLISCEENNTDNTAAASALALVSNNSSSTASTTSTTNTSVGPCSTTGPCKIFVTANTFPALNTNLGISGLDNFCNNSSDKPSGGGTYKALVTDGTNRIACTTANCSGGPSEHTGWVLKANKEYRRSNGTTIVGTTTANAIFTFPLTNSINNAIPFTNMTATGLNANWTSNSNHCSQWTGTGSFSMATYDSTSSDAIYAAGTAGCTNTAAIICVEQ
ncbi:DUF1554 domain-containing protein [Leptospira bourretii]|uniref:DUF1554 domain-containing protein n=1 Tax=Leptospira bourretii TaxID=2484962 RepID=UPI001FEE60CE|nr:DUF1554 domain-containing protein [Leptospira bourretii]